MPYFHIEYTYAADRAAVRDEHRPAHRAYFRTLADDGVLLFLGPYVDGTGAALMVDAADERAARALVDADPFTPVDAIAAVRITGWRQVIGPFPAQD